VTDFTGTVIPGATVQWSLPGGGGSLSGANPGAQITFTAGGTVGPFTIQATKPGYTNATATINVLASGAQIDSLSFVMAAGNKGGTLTLVGHDVVAGNVTANYSASPAGVTLTPSQTTSANGAPANVAVQFPSAGTFTLTATLVNGGSSSTVVNVPQVPQNQLQVCDVEDMVCNVTVTIQTLQSRHFTASGVDQFSNPITLTNVSWTNASQTGSASASFTAPSTIGQPIIVKATDQNSGRTGQMTVNLVSFDVSSAYAFPVPYKASAGTGIIHFSGLGNQWTLHLYTTSGRRIFDTQGSTNTFDWNIKNTSGESIASGVYFFVIESPQGKKNGKLIIIQ
jgi:hypothetical protein